MYIHLKAIWFSAGRSFVIVNRIKEASENSQPAYIADQIVQFPEELKKLEIVPIEARISAVNRFSGRCSAILRCEDYPPQTQGF